MGPAPGKLGPALRHCSHPRAMREFGLTGQAARLFMRQYDADRMDGLNDERA